MGDRERYIEEQDRAWQDAGLEEPTDPLMGSIKARAMSLELKSYVTRMAEADGHGLYGEVFLTNRYGAVIAMTDRTSDYRQGDEDWWQIAKRDGIHVTRLSWDTSSKPCRSPCVCESMTRGDFAGVLKAVIDVHEVVSVLDPAANNPSWAIALFTSDGRPIHVVGSGDTPLRDGSTFLPEADTNIETAKAHAIRIDPASSKKLVTAVATSRGFRSFPGLGWSVVIENDADVVFRLARKTAPQYSRSNLVAFGCGTGRRRHHRMACLASADDLSKPPSRLAVEMTKSQCQPKAMMRLRHWPGHSSNYKPPRRRHHG